MGFRAFKKIAFFFYSLSLLAGVVGFGIVCRDETDLFLGFFFRVMPLVTLVMIAIFVPLASFCCHSLVP